MRTQDFANKHLEHTIKFIKCNVEVFREHERLELMEFSGAIDLDLDEHSFEGGVKKPMRGG